jgi:hypothetical protein
MDTLKARKVSLWICEKCTVDEGKNHVVDECDDCKISIHYLDIDEIYCNGEGQHYCKECKDKNGT